MSYFLSEATPVILISPWKPLLVFVTFVAWAWLASTHLEKDAKAAHLNSQAWNVAFATSAGVGLAVMLIGDLFYICLLYTSPSPRDRTRSRMPSSA